jgi:hypothetical protein
MQTIEDWNRRRIDVAESGSGVRAVVHFADNLIRTSIQPWPPAEVVQKLYKSKHQSAFRDADRAAAIRVLTYYSDLQSLHSEDAITWSTFGPLIYGDSGARCRFVRSVFRVVRIPVDEVDQCIIWLWRRVAHPDTLVSGGPGIDFGIQSKDVIVLGESKWRGDKFTAKQGKLKNKDQLELRQDFLQKYAVSTWGAIPHMVVLAVSWKGNLLTSNDISLPESTLHLRDTTWDARFAGCEHPHKDELLRYVAWKQQNSQPA